MRIVISGGSGQVGQILARHFHARGFDVATVSRHVQPAAWSTIAWDGLRPGQWVKEIEGADVVINLAGRSVNCRYNRANRLAIIQSRILTTRLVGDAIGMSSRPPKLWMNASTATIYRQANDRPMDDIHGEIGGNEPGLPSTWRFSYDVATSWERAFFDAKTPNTRKIALRSSMIMSPDKGGVMDTLLNLVRLGLGGTAGSGQQFMSWIHDADFGQAIEFLIARDDLDGCINITSPNPVPNRDFMAGLRRAYGAPIGLPATTWMLEIGAIFLRTETELILKSRRVVPRRLLDAGFSFQFPEWTPAAHDLVQRWRSTPLS
ncbi:MAG TPA: TIGR01777 family oxidoreductase [Candidatus Dormibacteraeota bacterium]|nr:TIGR01777 family oxidoreductase [Candidatus Dormibacteraeota bacterium]